MGAAAKLMAYLGLDGREFKAGVDGAKREIEGFDHKMHGLAQTMKTGLGAAGIYMALHKAGAAVKELKEQSDRGVQNPLFSKEEIDKMANGFERIDSAVNTSKAVVAGWIGNLTVNMQAAAHFLTSIFTGSSLKEAAAASQEYINNVSASEEQLKAQAEAEKILGDLRYKAWFDALSPLKQFNELAERAAKLNREAAFAEKQNAKKYLVGDTSAAAVAARTALLQKQAEAIRLQEQADAIRKKMEADAAAQKEKDIQQEERLAKLREDSAERQLDLAQRAQREAAKLAQMEKDLAEFKWTVRGADAGDADVAREITARQIAVEEQRKIADATQKADAEHSAAAVEKIEKLQEEIDLINAAATAGSKQAEEAAKLAILDERRARVLEDIANNTGDNTDNYAKALEIEKERATIIANAAREERHRTADASRTITGGRGSIWNIGGMISGRSDNMPAITDPVLKTAQEQKQYLALIEEHLRKGLQGGGTSAATIIGNTP